jgi:putative hemolysin
MARMTGANSEAIRATARTSADPGDLPPASELIAQIADLFGIPAGQGGYAEAVDRDGAILIER